MSGNQKQAPTVMPQSQSHARYSPQGPYLPRPPTPGRTDGFHVPSQPYVQQQQQQQQQPPNQTGNQGPGPNLRGMPPTVPPTQSSTPPNTDMNKVQQMQQGPVNMSYVRQSPNAYFRASQSNQSTRMPQSLRQPSAVFQSTQPLFTPQPTQTPFMQIPMQPMILNSAIYSGQINPNGNQQTRYIPPNNIPYFYTPNLHYTQQPQLYYSTPFAAMQRPAHPAQVTAPQHVAAMGQQAQPQQIQAANYTQAAVQIQQVAQEPRKSKARIHAIKIIDPSTGKQIDDLSNSDQNESSSHPASGESSARQTPQPGTIQRDIKQEVQAEFAKQVAQTMHEDENRAISDDQSPHHHPQPPPQQQQQQQQQQPSQKQQLQMHHPVVHHHQQQPPPAAYHIDHQQAVTHHGAPYHQQQQQMPQVLAAPQPAQLPHYLHHAAAMPQPVEQPIYTYTGQEFMPRQQQQQQQQQQEIVTRQQQSLSSSKYQMGGDKESYDHATETPVVSAKQGEEVTVITTSSSAKFNHGRSMDMAKIIVKKHREELAPPPFEEHQQQQQQQQQPVVVVAQPIVEPVREEPPSNLSAANSEISASASEQQQQQQQRRDAKITVGSSNSSGGKAHAPAAVKEQQPFVAAAVAADVSLNQQQQQQYRDTTSTASNSNSSSSSTTINNNSVSNKKDDKPLFTEVPASSTPTEQEYPVAQAQDNAKSKQGSQRTKDVPKLQQQQQQAPTPQQVVPSKPAAPAVKLTVPVPQTQPSKPNSKTQKHKDLNIKGATKEGTDMDVFSDINTVPTTDDQISSTPAISTIKPDTKKHVADIPAAAAASEPIRAIPSVNANAVLDTASQPKKPELAPTIKSLPKSSYDVCAIVKEMPKPFVAPPPPAIDSKDQTDRCEALPDNQVQSKNDANKAPGDANGTENKVMYEDGQWAPHNMGGRKQYGKDFLLALSARPKCKEVPDIDTVVCREILKDQEKTHIGDNLNRSYGSSRSSDYNNWTGGKSASQKGIYSGANKLRHGSQHKSGVGGGGGGKGSKIGGPMVSISVKGDVKLHECENAWKPLRNKSADAETSEELAKTEELYRKVRGILNKLTPQKFDTLLTQVQKLTIDTETRLSGVINLVFDKAVDEPNFSVAYSNLCSHLSTLQVPIAADSKVPSNKDKHVNFRKLLLTRCQTEFESNSRNERVQNNKIQGVEDCGDPEKKKELLVQLEEDRRKIRMKSVGNIRFIGELFKQNMLTSNIMNSCLSNLLQNPDEESLECLCKLLSTIGKELERYKEKTNINGTFGTMKDIVNKKYALNISSRVRFMLQDVIELRASNWVPRRQDINPKTMDQIQKEADNEQMDIQVMNSMPPPIRNSGTPQDRNNRRGGGGGGGGGGGSGASRSINDDGWSPVTNRSNRPPVFSVQSDKLKIKQPQVGDERLGSMQQFDTWGRGSNIKTANANNPLSGGGGGGGGGATNTKNMYAALHIVEEDNYRHNRDPYASKGHSLEKYGKQYDAPSSRSGSQHRSQTQSSAHHDHAMDSQRSHGTGQSISLHLPSAASANQQPSLRPAPPMPQQHHHAQQQQQPALVQAPAPSAVAPAATAPAAIVPPPPPSRTVKYPTEKDAIAKLERRLHNIVDEYNGDLCTVEDVAKELEESMPCDYYNRFISFSLMHFLEKPQMFRQKTGNLLANLVATKKLSLDQYCIGLEEMLNNSPELEIDIPKLWDYMADMIVPAICLAALPFNRLLSISKEPISNDIAHKMLTALCVQIIRIKGPDFLQNAWISSGVSLSNFIPAAEVDAFVISNNLQILVGGSQLPKMNDSLSFASIRMTFVDFFEKSTSFDEICNWIIANIGDRIGEPYFIRPLVTAILEHSIVTEDAKKTKKFRSEVFDQHTNLLQRFISSDLDAQVQCLYATQTLINNWEHPQGLLLSIFDKYDESSLIAPEAVFKWEHCENPAENVGKGMCLMQLSAFINNLKEGEDSSEEA